MKEPKGSLARYAFGYSDRKPGWDFWVPVALAVGFVLYNMVSFSYGQPAPTPPVQAPAAVPLPPLPPASDDWQAGFCTGWNTAVQVEQQRYANWRALLQIGREEGAARSPAGQATDTLINSLQMYVLVQPATGQLTVDGRAVNCGAPVVVPPVPGGAVR